MKNYKAIDHESNGVNRHSFIEKTIFADAGEATLDRSHRAVRVVFLGYPTWGMQLPPPVKSFLRQQRSKGGGSTKRS